MLFTSVAGLFGSELAIDLGTANTVVYARQRGIISHEPSVIAMQKRQDGTRVVIGFGKAAKQMIGKTPDHINTLHPVRNGVVADTELTWLMLKRCIKHASRFRIGRRLRVVLGVSPLSSVIEQRAMIEPAKAAGADEIYLVYEPIAAALGAGLDIREPYGHMLVDIGGGTIDIAILSLGDLVYSKTLHLGGQTMDTAVRRLLRHKYQLEIGEQTAEWLKMTLGSLQPSSPKRRATVKGIDSITGTLRAEDVIADDVCNVLLDPVETLILSIYEAIEATPPELVTDIIDSGLTLTGGGALLHGLPAYLHERLGFPIRLAQEPMACVALGAGRILEHPELQQQVAMRL